MPPERDREAWRKCLGIYEKSPEPFRDFLVHEENVIYNRAEYFLIAHAFLVAGYAEIADNLHKLSLFIALFGLLFGLLWLLTSFRDWPSHSIIRRVLHDFFDYKPHTLPAKIRENLHPLFRIPAIPVVMIYIPLFVCELWGGMLIRSVYRSYLEGNCFLNWLFTNQVGITLIVVGTTVPSVPMLIFHQENKYNGWAKEILESKLPALSCQEETDIGKRKRKQAKWWWFGIGMAFIIFGLLLLISGLLQC